MKATLVRPGKKFAIVENTASKRKTEAMVTLGKENRLYGADSFLESGKYPLSTFSELWRTFGEKFDSDSISKMKDDRFVTNDIVADERGLNAWKVEGAGDDEGKESVLYSEEVVAMLLSYVKMLAEKQAESSVRQVVITIPSWFTYDQRLMIRDAAEQLSGLSVLQLVHENTAAAVLFGIDKVDKEAQNHTVLFYNMGGMDTEVTIARYSHLNVSEKAKKKTPYIEILAEANERDLGSKDLDLVLYNILADKFNAMKEREGKDDVRLNQRAAKRLLKEVVKIKEVLSANKQASVKVPELLDYVTLQLTLERSEVEEKAAPLFERVTKPIDAALAKAGLTLDDI
jgi:hypoxia up-regulated 1